MNNDDRESTLADFRMLYQALLNDIENTKRRQWGLTYYLLLLFATLIVFSDKIGIDRGLDFSLEKLVILGIAILLAIFGACYLCYLTGTIIRYRKRLQDTMPHLSPDFEKSEEKWARVRYGKRWRIKDISWWKVFRELALYLTLMLLGALALVFWYLLKSPEDCSPGLLCSGGMVRLLS